MTKRFKILPLLLAGLACLAVACGDEAPTSLTPMPPAGPLLEGTADQLAVIYQILNDTRDDFAASNFGLASKKIGEALVSGERAIRLELPLLTVSQRVYTADVLLRFDGDPAEALRQLEAAREYLKRVVLQAQAELKPLFGDLLEDLITIIDDIDVSREQKLVQLEALQRDLTRAFHDAQPSMQ